ncbi:MAG: AtpZ/AtpI family protein [Caulobacteraceae bacterium]
MTQPDDSSGEALRRLDARLETLKASRARPAPVLGATDGMAAGYRFLAEVVGGVLGGIGLGWLFDTFAHTAPLGIIVGMVVGLSASLYFVVSRAMKLSKEATDRAGPLPSVPDDEDD